MRLYYHMFLQPYITFSLFIKNLVLHTLYYFSLNTRLQLSLRRLYSYTSFICLEPRSKVNIIFLVSTCFPTVGGNEQGTGSGLCISVQRSIIDLSCNLGQIILFFSAYASSICLVYFKCKLFSIETLSVFPYLVSLNVLWGL